MLLFHIKFLRFLWPLFAPGPSVRRNSLMPPNSMVAQWRNAFYNLHGTSALRNFVCFFLLVERQHSSEQRSLQGCRNQEIGLRLKGNTRTRANAHANKKASKQPNARKARNKTKPALQSYAEIDMLKTSSETQGPLLNLEDE